MLLLGEATVVRDAPTLVVVTDSPHKGHRFSPWRIGTPVVVLLCGGLFVVSAENSEGTDLRPGRYNDLATLVEREADRVEAVRDQVAELTAEVEALSQQIEDTQLQRYQREIRDLRDPAGLEPRTGPGVTIVLSDAPDELIRTTDNDPNLMVVHQQDIQAVVNALWKGGAQAVTIEGQRVITTTGIKCEGNAVQLQGVPYPEPYVIQAVGDPGDLLMAVESDDYLELYREQAEDPDIAVGWDLSVEDRVEAPAYDGLLDLTYAEPSDG